MNDALWNRVSTVTLQCHRRPLQIDQKLSVEHEEEFIPFIMFVPMELALQYPQAHNGIIHPAKRLVVPFIFTSCDQPRDVDNLEEVELGVKMY